MHARNILLVIRRLDVAKPSPFFLLSCVIFIASHLNPPQMVQKGKVTCSSHA